MQMQNVSISPSLTSWKPQDRQG